jgi:hypothetical protein
VNSVSSCPSTACGTLVLQKRACNGCRGRQGVLVLLQCGIQMSRCERRDKFSGVEASDIANL